MSFIQLKIRNVILHTEQCLLIHNYIPKPAKINVSKVPAFS